MIDSNANAESADATPESMPRASDDVEAAPGVSDRRPDPLPEFDPEAVKTAAAMIDRSERPILYLGQRAASIAW